MNKEHPTAEVEAVARAIAIALWPWKSEAMPDEKWRDFVAHAKAALEALSTKESEPTECPTCQGRGEHYYAAPGLPRAPMPQQCDDCYGTGSISPTKESDLSAENERLESDWFDKAIRDHADEHGPSGGAWNISMVLERLHRARAALQGSAS